MIWMIKVYTIRNKNENNKEFNLASSREMQGLSVSFDTFSPQLLHHLQVTGARWYLQG
jgi:hypothetical protein